MRSFHRQRHQRWFVATLAALVVALQIFTPLWAMPAPSAPAPRPLAAAALIPIEQQPFYAELELTSPA
mgnify:CR=1 FL=1